MIPLEGAVGVIIDAAGILSGVAAIIAAAAGIISARKAGQAARQTNGPLTAQGHTIDLILDGQRSLGHQVGEIRKDMGRMDERLTTEVQALQDRIDPRRPARKARQGSSSG